MSATHDAVVANDSFIAAMRARLARISAGTTATRGNGPGVCYAARTHLKDIDLTHFVVGSRKLFGKRLTQATENLRLSLPKKAQTFGLARKLLNIYLREATYNHHLRTRYGLDAIEPWLEVPLDKWTGKELQKEFGAPQWTKIRDLSPETSKEYQQIATREAEKRALGLPPVHLDVFYWGNRPDPPPKRKRNNSKGRVDLARNR